MKNTYSMENIDPQIRLYNELSKFNWGAFFLNIIWAIPNGALKECWPVSLLMLILLFLTQIPIFGWAFFIVNILLAVHFGKKGNEWAWYAKKWSSLEDFSKTQKIWAGFSPILFGALCMVIPTVITSVTMMFVMPHAKKLVAKENDTLKTAVSRIVTSPKYETFKSGVDIVNYMVESKLYSRYAIREPEAVFVEKSGPYSVSLAFNKDDEECSLLDKNCYVDYRIKTTKDPILKNRIYFDDNGEIEFDERFK